MNASKMLENQIILLLLTKCLNTSSLIICSSSYHPRVFIIPLGLEFVSKCLKFETTVHVGDKVNISIEIHIVKDVHAKIFYH